VSSDDRVEFLQVADFISALRCFLLLQDSFAIDKFAVLCNRGECYRNLDHHIEESLADLQEAQNMRMSYPCQVKTIQCSSSIDARAILAYRESTYRRVKETAHLALLLAVVSITEKNL